MKRTLQILTLTCLLLLSGQLTAQSVKKATKDSCLVFLSLTDFDDRPILYAYLTITVYPNKDKIYATTNRKGKVDFLIPKKGRTYYEVEVSYRNDKFKFDKQFSIPADEGAYELTANLKYRSKYLALYEVEFQTNKAILLPKSYQELNRVAEMMMSKPEMVIEVSGHTDSVGNFEHNMVLSQKRAFTVKDYLIKQNIDSLRVVAKGFGPTVPIGDNQTDEGRQRNRRIEVRILED